MQYFIFTIGLIVFLLFPKAFLVFYFIFKYYNKYPLDNIFSRIFEWIMFFYISILLSIMLANRPYYVGVNIGYGDDMLHYYNAFSWVGSTTLIEFFTDFNRVTQLTGSAEPLFWIVVKIITLFVEDGFYIHCFITFLGCLIIYISGQIWSKSGLLFIFLYTNTITFFAFQGSAIRSGLAFAVALLGYVIFTKYKKSLIQFLAPFIHFSMIPMPIINYAGFFNNFTIKNKIYIAIISITSIFFFIFLSKNSLESGLGAKISSRLSESLTDTSSIFQFILESFFTIIIILIYRRRIDNNPLVKSFLIFFVVCLIVLALSPTAFSRFYRYEYIFMILIYTNLFVNSSRFMKAFVLLVSFGWLIFIAETRYVGVFSNNILEFLSLNAFAF